MPLSALLFDLDGSLVDSEPLHCEAHRLYIESRGLPITQEEIFGNIGKSDRGFYQRILDRHGIAESPQDWMDGKNRMLDQLYRAGRLQLMPGAHQVLEAAWTAGIVTCVVTSSHRHFCALALEVTGLAARLPIRVCHEDVVNRKPSPEPYLTVINRLSVPPARCLVIEDSVYGVTAARAAGCRVAGMRGYTAEAEVLAAGAERMISDLRDVLPLDQWLTPTP